MAIASIMSMIAVCSESVALATCDILIYIRINLGNQILLSKDSKMVIFIVLKQCSVPLSIHTAAVPDD